MSDDGKLTISTFLVFLRQKLLEARAAKDEKLLGELENTFYLLEDAALEAGDRKLAAMSEELECAVRDTFMGAEWKSNIPTVEEIKEAFD